MWHCVLFFMIIVVVFILLTLDWGSVGMAVLALF